MGAWIILREGEFSTQEHGRQEQASHDHVTVHHDAHTFQVLA
jgi:hypothetical protein